ncbi:hypothetical protein [Blastococcus colisei]|uniref:hypothetical protein n=1 Tax=Blastococcus colisei TaxID=1564162 RepID=UPI001476BA45|nr:hypothetical protein [Blastococcus colisei]
MALAVVLAPPGLLGGRDAVTQGGLESASHFRTWWWAEWFSKSTTDSLRGRAVKATPVEARGTARKAAGQRVSSSAATSSSRRADDARETARSTTATAPSTAGGARKTGSADPTRGPAPTAEQGADSVGSAPATAGSARTGLARTGSSSSEGILLSPAELMALPTSGPGWDAIMARVAKPYGGSYTLGTREDANKDVLAHALAGARLDNDAYKGFVRDKVERIMTAPRNDGDLLATLRQLQTYVVSADLIDLASFDPALDARFRTWLAAEVRFSYSGGGGGGSVISNHDKKPNNYGTHAGATRVAAAIYLGDDAELQAARDVWYGWATGDPAYSHTTRKWTGTSWQCDPNRPAGINGAGCARDGQSLDGVIPEDQVRCGEFSRTPCETNYIHGATDGMTLAFWMLARQGEDPWAWGDHAALRQMQWKYANGQAPYSGFRWQIPVIEAAYGVDFAGNTADATSTNFGFADWWAQ